MFGNVTAAEILARHRAADLERRNEIRRRRSAWSGPTTAQRLPASRRAAAPSAPGFAAVLLQSLETSRPRTAR